MYCTYTHTEEKGGDFISPFSSNLLKNKHPPTSPIQQISYNSGIMPSGLKTRISYFFFFFLDYRISLLSPLQVPFSEVKLVSPSEHP
jgi:hypothetical protein